VACAGVGVNDTYTARSMFSPEMTAAARGSSPMHRHPS